MLTERRRDPYLKAIASSPLIPAGRRQLIRTLASHVPLGVVCGAFSDEMKVVFSTAGLDDAIANSCGN